MQIRGAAKNDGWAFRTRPEQHRQHAEVHILAHNDVSRKVSQNLAQALVLGREATDEHAFDADAQELRPRRHMQHLGKNSGHVSQIEIGAGRKRMKFCSDAFDAVAHNGTCEANDLVTFGDEDAAYRQQRIEVTHRRRRSNKDFHVVSSV